jgi:hypothetical protein
MKSIIANHCGAAEFAPVINSHYPLFQYRIWQGHFSDPFANMTIKRLKRLQVSDFMHLKMVPESITSMDIDMNRNIIIF